MGRISEWFEATRLWYWMKVASLWFWPSNDCYFCWWWRGALTALAIGIVLGALVCQLMNQ